MIDLAGRRFGRLHVCRYLGGGQWRCVCDCGVEKSIRGSDLLSRRTRSCGCFRSEVQIMDGKLHQAMYPRLYRIWKRMRCRCSNPRTKDYRYYGAKGVTVCKEWNDFTPFADWALAHGYRDGLTIDRIDSSGNYCPENCQWISRSENSRRAALERHRKEKAASGSNANGST